MVGIEKVKTIEIKLADPLILHIVHCESNILESKNSSKLMNIIKSTNGLELKQEKYIVVKAQYLETIIDLSESFFDELVKLSLLRLKDVKEIKEPQAAP